MSIFLYEQERHSDSYLEKVPDFESKLKFDPLTYRHSLNVAHLSVQLLKQSRYEYDKDLLYYAGLFHDVGKAIMPLTVLKKQNRLTRDEFNEIKEHARQGFRILQRNKFPSDILFVALLHHEKYDGSGYPIGLIGKEIPVAARIVSICDVFDALTSDRPYRKAYPIEDAIQIMENTKEQFDPELIDIFINGIARAKTPRALSKP